MGLKYSIRMARSADLDLLPDLEERADHAYAELDGFSPMLARDGLSAEQCHNLPKTSQVWMAITDKPVGFIIFQDVDHLTYLAQLCVVPEVQGNGIGTALMHTAIAKAQADGKPGIVLATYKNVVFNGPYYASLGFKDLKLDQMGPQLRQLAIQDEKEWGCFGPRVVMGLFF